MTAQEFVFRLAPTDMDRLAAVFNYLADNMHEMRLLTGERLRDELDFAAFHRELAAACRFREVQAS